VITAFVLGLTPQPGPRPPKNSGDFGGDLKLLASFYAAPAGQGNHFIDMWSGGEMVRFARAHGLTNNRALFIISHGCGRTVAGKRRYALYPAPAQLKDGTRTPYYSAQDIARLLGRTTVTQIDNLIISGCNSENRLDLKEWRESFPNATNIIHAGPGKDGYDFLLRHVLLYASSEIKWLHDTPESFAMAGFDDKKRKIKMPPKLNLYMASLYKPGATEPFAVQLAGRELLEPERMAEREKPAQPPPSPAPRPIPLAAAATRPPAPAKARRPNQLHTRPPLSLAVAAPVPVDSRKSAPVAALFTDLAAGLAALALACGIGCVILECRALLRRRRTTVREWRDRGG
jgi:hypothetical protein